jgi:proteic killer suppression protein
LIQSFGDPRTEDVWNGTTNARTRALPEDMLRIAVRKLDILQAAKTINDLRVAPGNHLEALRGDRAGRHSIRINKQWRIVFSWTDDGPADVTIEDYH